MTARRRVLFVTHTAPIPPVSGERLRAFNLMRELVRRKWEVSLFSIEHGPVASDDLESLNSISPAGVLVQRRPRPAWRLARSRLDVLRGRAFQDKFFLNRRSRRAFHEWLGGQEFDVVVVALSYMLTYLPAELRCRTVLDSQNAEYHRLQSMASADSLSLRSLAARSQLKAVERFERDATQSVARTTAVSQREVAYFQQFTPGRVDLVPNGVDTQGLPVISEEAPDPQILFVGSLDYGANVDAVGFLIEEVLPRITHTGVRLVVVGSNPRSEVQRLAKRSPKAVEIVGRAPSTEPYFAASRMLLVPLRFGGGTRLKILESFARGRPVVTTTVGCEGLDVEHEHDLLIADGAAALAQAIDRLLGDPELGRRLTLNGRQLVEQKYDWSAIAGQLEKSLETAISSAPPGEFAGSQAGSGGDDSTAA